MMKTTSVRVKNAAYQKFEALKANRSKRHQAGEFFVEGVRNINEAVRNGWRVVSFLFTGEKPLSRWAREMISGVRTEENFELSRPLMEELSGKQETSELLALVGMRPDDLAALRFSDRPLLALFDRPSNHGNLGTILRSCDSLGVEALLLTGHGVDLYDPAVVTASMGSFFRVPAIRVPDKAAVLAFIDGMKRRYPGFQAVGTTAHREKNLFEVDFTRPTMLLIGNETDGLCHAFKERSDVLATIPMDPASSASSLNVGCAATVLFYEAARQRLAAGGPGGKLCLENHA